ncbi:MAG: hypothetical protein WBX25_07115 [Rhodomicrobium sp.]
MKRDEIALEVLPLGLIEIGRQRFGRTIAADESFPRRCAARLAVVGNALFES